MGEKRPISNIELSEEQRRSVLLTYSFAKDFFDRAKEEGVMMGAHGLDHGLRVVGNTLLICQGEGTDPFLPTITALLIDIGRSVDDPRAKNWQHGFVSAELSEPFLEELGLSEQDKNIVLNALKDHSRRNELVDYPSSVVKAVMDGDRLSTVGPLGPLRAAATRPHLPLILPESEETSTSDDDITSVFFDVKYRQPEWFGWLWTPTARKMAERKKIFHEYYVQEVEKDVAPAYNACREIGLPLDLS